MIGNERTGMPRSSRVAKSPLTLERWTVDEDRAFMSTGERFPGTWARSVSRHMWYSLRGHWQPICDLTSTAAIIRSDDYVVRHCGGRRCCDLLDNRSSLFRGLLLHDNPCHLQPRRSLHLHRSLADEQVQQVGHHTLQIPLILDLVGKTSPAMCVAQPWPCQCVGRRQGQ